MHLGVTGSHKSARIPTHTGMARESESIANVAAIVRTSADGLAETYRCAQARARASASARWYVWYVHRRDSHCAAIHSIRASIVASTEAGRRPVTNHAHALRKAPFPRRNGHPAGEHVSVELQLRLRDHGMQENDVPYHVCVTCARVKPVAPLCVCCMRRVRKWPDLVAQFVIACNSCRTEIVMGSRKSRPSLRNREFGIVEHVHIFINIYALWLNFNFVNIKNICCLRIFGSISDTLVIFFCISHSPKI